MGTGSPHGFWQEIVTQEAFLQSVAVLQRRLQVLVLRAPYWSEVSSKHCSQDGQPAPPGVGHIP